MLFKTLTIQEALVGQNRVL